MSDLETFERSLARAAAFNAKASKKWTQSIPEQAIRDEPFLAHPPGSKDFATGVANMQRKFWPQDLGSQDGKLGVGTWTHMMQVYAQVNLDSNYVIHNQSRVSLGPSEAYQITNFDHVGGIDLHPAGNFHKGRGKANYPINYLVLHWGSTSPQRLSSVLTNRDLSSHFGIGGSDIYQYLDTYHRAWHAGPEANSWSVGIDFCQQPTEGWVPRLQKDGWDVQLQTNTTGRGDKQICSLNTKAVKAGRQFIEDLCKALGIPFQIPRGKDGLASTGEPFYGVLPTESLKNGDFRGVIGHHHARKTKWDIAPWWEQLFGDLW